jgi:hypothetical protein
VYGGRASALTVTVNTEEATATADGGVAPLSYLWTLQPGYSGAWVVATPTAQTTRFTCGDLGPGDSGVADFLCTVTDAVGAHIASNTVNATAINYGSGYT